MEQPSLATMATRETKTGERAASLASLCTHACCLDQPHTYSKDLNRPPPKQPRQYAIQRIGKLLFVAVTIGTLATAVDLAGVAQIS